MIILVMVLFEKSDIEVIARERLTDERIEVTNEQFKRIVNCIWREINEKQKIRPFNTELAARTRIRALTKIFQRLQI